MTRSDAHRRLHWGLLLGLLAPGSTPAQAAPAHTVVLLRTPVDAPGRWRVAEDRTRDELRMMGIGVVEVEAREDPAAIEHLMAVHGALAAVQVAREDESGAAAIWRMDPGRGELGAVRIDGLTIEGGGAASVAALRAAELVRAQSRGEGGDLPVPGDLLAPPGAQSAAAVEAGAVARPPLSLAGTEEVGVVPAAHEPSSSEVSTDRVRPAPDDGLSALDVVEAAPPTDEPAPRRRDPRAPGDRGFGVYAGVGGGPGGAGTLVGGGLAPRWHVLRNLAIQGDLRGATSPIWLSGHGHSFRVGLAGARAALVYVARPEARVSWRLGLGGGVTLSWALARSPDRLRRSLDWVVVGALGASVQAAIRVRAHMRLLVGVDVELLVPPVAVRVLGAEVARLGQPLLRGVLGLEWDWSSRARR